MATSKDLAERPNRSAEKVERCLIALAECNGNSRATAAKLAEDGIHMHNTTLIRWKNEQYPERYERIRAEVLPRINQEAAERHRDMAERMMSTEEKLRERLHAEVDKLDVRDLSGAMRNATVGVGIHTEKARELTEQPMEIERGSAESVLRKLAGRGLSVKATERVVERSVEAVESST